MYRAKKMQDPEWRQKQLERLLSWLKKRAPEP